MVSGRFVVTSCLLLVLPMLLGAKPAKNARIFKDAKTVELFSAIENGEIEVKLIPKDATLATVIVKNQTKQPLSIKMPNAFAGVPVLGQDDFGGDFGGNNGGGAGQNQGQGNQAFGGGMGGMGGGMGGMGGMMGGMMNVAAERVQKVKLQTVCLQHGKKDPNPKVPYKLRPIESFSSDQNVHEVLNMLGRGEIDQVSAQAATWHLTDGLTAQQLASKVKVRHLNGTVEMYFNPIQMRKAAKIVQVAKTRAEKRGKKEASPGEDTEALPAL